MAGTVAAPGRSETTRLIGVPVGPRPVCPRPDRRRGRPGRPRCWSAGARLKPAGVGEDAGLGVSQRQADEVGGHGAQLALPSEMVRVTVSPSLSCSPAVGPGRGPGRRRWRRRGPLTDLDLPAVLLGRLAAAPRSRPTSCGTSWLGTSTVGEGRSATESRRPGQAGQRPSGPSATARRRRRPLRRGGTSSGTVPSATGSWWWRAESRRRRCRRAAGSAIAVVGGPIALHPRRAAAAGPAVGPRPRP